jgi:hypothetical protein
MQIIRRLVAMSRSVRLNRQYREIERAINQLPLVSRPKLAALTMREYANAAKCDVPLRLGARPAPGGADPCKGLDLAFTQVKSADPQVHLRGVALWLAIAYHETRTSEPNLHRQLMRTLRMLKEIAPPIAADLWDSEKTVA